MHAFLDNVLAELPGERREAVTKNLKDELLGVIEPLIAADVLQGAPGTPRPITPGQEPPPPPPTTGYGRAQNENSALREARDAAGPYVAPEGASAAASNASGTG